MSDTIAQGTLEMPTPLLPVPEFIGVTKTDGLSIDGLLGIQCQIDLLLSYPSFSLGGQENIDSLVKELQAVLDKY